MVFAVGQFIKEEDIIANFNTRVHNTITGLTVWHTTASLPDRFPTAELAPRDPGGPAAGDIKALDPTPAVYEITAQYIARSLTDWTKTYTATRKCQYNRWCHLIRHDDGAVSQDYWYIDNGSPIDIAALIQSYVQTGDPTVVDNIDSKADLNDIKTGALVTHSGMSNYIGSLYSSWNVAKENLTVVNSYYCHNDCHWNCHWSRGGR